MTPSRPKAPGAARETTSIAATAASMASRTAPSSGSTVFVSQANADQAHQSVPSNSAPRRRPPQVGLRVRKLVTCVMAKTTTRSKKSSRGVTRCPPSACRSPMCITFGAEHPSPLRERDLLTHVAVQDRSEPVHLFLQGRSRRAPGLLEPRDADLLAGELPGPG